MTSREWEDFQRTVLGDKDVSKSPGITATQLLGLGTNNTFQDLDRLLSDPLNSFRTPLSPRNSTRSVPALSETINVLSSAIGNSGQRPNTLLSKALGLAPLVRGVFSLFNRSDTNETSQQMRFSLPAPLRTEAAMSSESLTVNIDRGMGDRLRPILGLDDQVVPVRSGAIGSPSMSHRVSNITVQVNAIDSRSFLDHSEDIARAVRDAMLHSHSLNDVVSDL
jgi:hypothetical protein